MLLLCRMKKCWHIKSLLDDTKNVCNFDNPHTSKLFQERSGFHASKSRYGLHGGQQSFINMTSSPLQERVGIQMTFTNNLWITWFWGTKYALENIYMPPSSPYHVAISKKIFFKFRVFVIQNKSSREKFSLNQTDVQSMYQFNAPSDVCNSTALRNIVIERTV